MFFKRKKQEAEKQMDKDEIALIVLNKGREIICSEEQDSELPFSCVIPKLTEITKGKE